MVAIAVELATAYISILPSSSKLAPEIKKQLGAIPSEKSGGQIGDGLLAGIGKTLKVGALALGGVAAAGIGTALFKGMERLDSLDQATAKLTGLGHSAGTVQTIMDNALASVKGTAFGMGDAATVAANMVAAGIKPGAELERTLRLVGDAATIAGTDMGSLGAIFGKVAASNKVQMDVINQLHDAGVPALSLLADQMGATSEEASKMASAGEIDFATFQAAMESGMGGAALESGATFSGAMDNMMAALGRVGANLLTGVFPQMKEGLGGITEFLAPLEEKAKEAGAAFGVWVSDVGPKVVTVLTSIGDAVGGVFTWIADNIELVKGFAIAFGLLGAAVLVYRGIVALLALPMQIATAAQIAWNIAMNLNPIGIIITLIVALVAAIIWIATQTTFFQDVWANVSQFLMDTWANISSFFMTIWNGIVAVFQTVWSLIVLYVTTYINVVRSIITTVVNFISGLWNSVWGGISSFFSTIWAGIVAYVTFYINMVRTIISNIVKAISTIWKNIWTGISSFFSGIWKGITNAVGKFGSFFKNAFSGISGFVKNAFNGVLSAVKNPINAIIGLVNKAINSLNGLSVTIPDWVPLVGGQTWGLSLPTIPKLANGAVISSSRGGSLVNVGEGRWDEAVVPLGGPQFDRLGEALAERVGGSGVQVAQHFTQQDPVLAQRAAGREITRMLASV